MSIVVSILVWYRRYKFHALKPKLTVYRAQAGDIFRAGSNRGRLVTATICKIGVVNLDFGIAKPIRFPYPPVRSELKVQ